MICVRTLSSFVAIAGLVAAVAPSDAASVDYACDPRAEFNARNRDALAAGVGLTKVAFSWDKISRHFSLASPALGTLHGRLKAIPSSRGFHGFPIIQPGLKVREYNVYGAEVQFFDDGSNDLMLGLGLTASDATKRNFIYSWICREGKLSAPSNSPSTTANASSPASSGGSAATDARKSPETTAATNTNAPASNANNESNRLEQSRMEIFGVDVPNHILAPLTVALILFVAGIVWAAVTARFRKKIAAAPRQYVDELDKLIGRAIAEGETNAVINARAIVSARNSLRDSMAVIASRLNSEIDRLADDIGESHGLWTLAAQVSVAQGMQSPATTTESSAAQPASASGDEEIRSAAWQTIQVLSRIWPAKKVQIEVELRKVLAELGLMP